MTVVAFWVVAGLVVVVWLIGLSMRAYALKQIAPGLPEVFISYRRDDSEETSNRLKEFLAGQFGHKRVFLDKRTIEWGADFPTEIERYLRAAHIVFVMIGNKWEELSRDGKPRIKHDDDWVRREIKTALRLRKRVVPVLINNRSVPAPESLPKDVQDLLRLSGVVLCTDDQFEVGASQLADVARKQAPATSHVRWFMLSEVAWALPMLLLFGLLAGDFLETQSQTARLEGRDTELAERVERLDERQQQHERYLPLSLSELSAAMSEHTDPPVVENIFGHRFQFDGIMTSIRNGQVILKTLDEDTADAQIALTPTSDVVLERARRLGSGVAVRVIGTFTGNSGSTAFAGKLEALFPLPAS